MSILSANLDRFPPTHAGHEYPLNGLDFSQIFSDVLDTRLYVNRSNAGAAAGNETTYQTNDELWRDILGGKLRPESRIVLEHFLVTEWLPLAPGRFFTERAEESRRRAREFWRDEMYEFLPLGKIRMVLGGIGCLRLGARHTRDQSWYLLGASSTGTMHEGVPLEFASDLYSLVIDTIKASGSCRCDVLGTLHVLGNELSVLTFDRDVPRYILAVDDVRPVARASNGDVQVTVASMYSNPGYGPSAEDLNAPFAADGYTTYLPKGWVYATFHPDEADVGARRAAEWMESYACRHSPRASDANLPPILSDFDEHRAYFQSPVEFALRDLGAPIDVQRLGAYAQYYNLTINTLNTGAVVQLTDVHIDRRTYMGDVIKNIGPGAIVVNRSSLSNAFNSIESLGGPEAREALDHLAHAVSESGNADATESLNGLTEELEKSEPSKGRVRIWLNAIAGALPDVATVAAAVAKLGSIFAV